MKIEDIPIPKERLEELEIALKTLPNPSALRDRIMKKVGRPCNRCGNIARKKVINRRYGANVLEYYCLECFSNDRVELVSTNGIDHQLAVKDKRYHK